MYRIVRNTLTRLGRRGLFLPKNWARPRSRRRYHRPFSASRQKPSAATRASRRRFTSHRNRGAWLRPEPTASRQQQRGRTIENRTGCRTCPCRPRGQATFGRSATSGRRREVEHPFLELPGRCELATDRLGLGRPNLVKGFVDAGSGPPDLAPKANGLVTECGKPFVKRRCVSLCVS